MQSNLDILEPEKERQILRTIVLHHMADLIKEIEELKKKLDEKDEQIFALKIDLENNLSVPCKICPKDKQQLECVLLQCQACKYYFSGIVCKVHNDIQGYCIGNIQCCICMDVKIRCRFDY